MQRKQKEAAEAWKQTSRKERRKGNCRQTHNQATERQTAGNPQANSRGKPQKGTQRRNKTKKEKEESNINRRRWMDIEEKWNNGQEKPDKGLQREELNSGEATERE